MFVKVLKEFAYVDATGKTKYPKVDSVIELSESDCASLLKRKSVEVIDQPVAGQKTKRGK